MNRTTFIKDLLFLENHNFSEIDRVFNMLELTKELSVADGPTLNVEILFQNA